MSQELPREYLELCLYVNEYIQKNGNVDRAILSLSESIMQSDNKVNERLKTTIDVNKVLEHLNKNVKSSSKQCAHTSVSCSEEHYNKENNTSKAAHVNAQVYGKPRRSKINKVKYKNTSLSNCDNCSSVNENKEFDLNAAYEQLLVRLKT